MGFSLIRLTLYGLIVSIDMDLRNAIKENLATHMNIDEIIHKEKLFEIKKRASSDGIFDNDDDDIYDYLDFPDSYQVLNSHKNKISGNIISFLKDKNIKFELLIPIRNRVMHARPLQFNDFATVDSFVRHVIRKYKSIFPRLCEFEEKTKENPNYVYSLDLSNLEKAEGRIPHNLPLPDYDETGFVGREVEIQDLLLACKGGWPVINVIGEGGLGKTALAVKIAYEILDDENSDFEAIVWVTAKRTVLTLSDIKNIDGAIQDSLGLIKGAAEELGAHSEGGQVIEEVSEYLNTFKILLILDNLETVIDPVLREFIRKTTGKSKILATSRVGIGEMSYPLRLSGLKKKEAIDLLRCTSKVRRVSTIYQSSNEILGSYVEKMNMNAGFIKWFVASVQVGKRPDDVIFNPKTFLDFCMSNVYEYVSEHGKLICKAMISVPGKLSLSLISYLSGLFGDDLQEALSVLQSANIVTLNSKLTNSGAETTFELNDIPRRFILNNHPPSREEDIEFKRKRKDVAALYEKIQSDRIKDPYNFRSILCRNSSDAIVVKLLSEALHYSAVDKMDISRRCIEKAIELDPSFYEVYRVKAVVEAFGGQFPIADEAYKNAIDLEPRSAPLHYWYGGFLLRGPQDTEGAEREFTIAEEIDPEAPSILVELARVKMYLNQFSEADKRLEIVLENPIASSKNKRIAYDTWMQVLIREAQRELDSGRNSECLDICAKIPLRFNEIPKEFIDEKLVKTTRKSIPLVSNLINNLSLSNRKIEAEKCLEKIEKISFDFSLSLESPYLTERLEIIEKISEEDIGKTYKGRIKSFNKERKFGFIIFENKNIFFHFSDFENLYSDIKIGSEVSFRIEKEKSGERFQAKSIKTTELQNEQVKFKGKIKTIINDKNFGFITLHNGEDVFFHKSNLVEGFRFDFLVEGDEITCVLNRNHKGVVADKIDIFIAS